MIALPSDGACVGKLQRGRCDKRQMGGTFREAAGNPEPGNSPASKQADKQPLAPAAGSARSDATRLSQSPHRRPVV